LFNSLFQSLPGTPKMLPAQRLVTDYRR